MEGHRWQYGISIYSHTVIFTGAFSYGSVDTREKDNIRSKDKWWVAANIPSSIWWDTEIHHDWENGARMYLLTKEEHKKRTRDERNKERP